MGEGKVHGGRIPEGSGIGELRFVENSSKMERVPVFGIWGSNYPHFHIAPLGAEETRGLQVISFQGQRIIFAIGRDWQSSCTIACGK
jgi:hypothetical protein